MKEIGINKRLYDRRLELGYSIKEACIRLDMSKTKLNLIENGYVKVKNVELQKKFIFKYKLEENFFESNSLEYPSPLIEDVEKVTADSKIVKLFKKLPFKIGTLVLSLGFIGMFSLGLYRGYTDSMASHFSDRYNAAASYVKENGNDHLLTESKTSQMLLSNYKSLEYEKVPNYLTYLTDSSLYEEDEFIYESINFPNYSDYIGYSFFNNAAIVNLKNTTGLDLGNAVLYYESRMTDSRERLHFYAYTEEDYLTFGTHTVHFSADYDYLTYRFTYNLMEVIDYTGNVKKVDSSNFIAGIYKNVFEGNFLRFEISKYECLDHFSNELKYESLEAFNTEQASGLVNAYKYQNMNTFLTIFGIVAGTLFFALFVLSIIVTTAFGKKVIDVVSLENENNVGKVDKKKEYKPLPKNKFPSPVIPEFAIRIIAFILMVIGSMSLYYIFNSIINGDIVGTIESLNYRAAVASFTTLGMILIFFIKLDIIQNKKSTFILNFTLFFAGFVFYVLTLVLSDAILNSPALERFSIILDFLPGNIVWGILAFNMLTTILLSTPKFKKNIRRNTVIYRCFAILPLGYMIASCIIQIGKKAWGWKLPLAVSSLFFTKAIIITAFTILYCLVIYVYRKIVEAKFGAENAETYKLGNRYQYIKNLLVCVIFAILALIDYFAGLNATGAKVGLGANIGIIFLIPFVLFYHPHRGERNKKWDLVFNIAYGFSMLIGIVCILSTVSIYITSL